MSSVLVIGAGFMGSGIAQVCAQAGYDVHLMDIDPAVTDKALGNIHWSVEKLASMGAIHETPDQVMSRLTPATDLAGAAEADWVIEAAWEEEELKRDLFHALDLVAGRDTLLASNTSSIPIGILAACTNRPQNVLGLHFFGPVPLMRLVEVVQGDKTSPDVLERGATFVRLLGKTPIRVHRDIPGFVMNRIFSAALREAVDLVEQGIVSVEDVDVGMRLGYGWNAGPFEICDNAGIDTVSRVGKSIQALGAEHLAFKSDLVERMVRQGRLGRKVGKGFYDYASDGKRVPRHE